MCSALIPIRRQKSANRAISRTSVISAVARIFPSRKALSRYASLGTAAVSAAVFVGNLPAFRPNKAAARDARSVLRVSPVHPPPMPEVLLEMNVKHA